MVDGVVLLHGIFRTKRSMRPVERFLQKSGFKTLNVDYPSTRLDIGAIVEAVQPQIDAFQKTIDGPIHFVGYSMGGLLIRAYLKRFRPENLGRVVMLGTPNQGSPVADFLQNFFLYKWLYGPAGQQLITDQSGFTDLWHDVDYELGILAGNKSIDPISSWIIGGINDGKVSVESTKIPGMKDHIVVAATHTFFPGNKEAHRQMLAFIQNGAFER